MKNSYVTFEQIQKAMEEWQELVLCGGCEEKDTTGEATWPTEMAECLAEFLVKQGVFVERAGDSFTRLHNCVLSGQEIKADCERQRAKGGNHLRKGDEGKRAAPWGDLSGGAIHEGDRVHTPDHGDGTVIYERNTLGLDAWRVDWDRGYSLQLFRVLKELRQKEAAKPKTAPVRDYYGQEIREGDTIRHPNGKEGKARQAWIWCVWYMDDNGLARESALADAVGAVCKGVVVKRAEVAQ